MRRAGTVLHAPACNCGNSHITSENGSGPFAKKTLEQPERAKTEKRPGGARNRRGATKRVDRSAE
jgi:hypothetical protein